MDIKNHIDCISRDELDGAMRFCNEVSLNSVGSSPPKIPNNAAAPNGIPEQTRIIYKYCAENKTMRPARENMKDVGATNFLLLLCSFFRIQWKLYVDLKHAKH